jgi:hypothetical protein
LKNPNVQISVYQAQPAIAAFEQLRVLLCLNLARVAGQLHYVNKGRSYLTSSSSSSSNARRQQQQRRLQESKFHEQLYDAIGMTAAQKEAVDEFDTARFVVKQVRVLFWVRVQQQQGYCGLVVMGLTKMRFKALKAFTLSTAVVCTVWSLCASIYF